MAKFTIKGNVYSSGKIDLFKQLQLEKRIGPVYPALAAAKAVSNADPMVGLGYVTSSFNRMSDEDLLFVVNECLAVVQVQQGEGLWVQIKTPGSQSLQFDDLTLSDIHLIVFYVLKETFEPFIAALPDLVSVVTETIKSQE